MVRSLLIAALAASTTALNVARREAQELYTIELAPGVTKQVTEAEKYALKAEGKTFFDITEFSELTELAANKLQAAAVVYPTAVAQQDAVEALLPSLNKTLMQSNLQTFSNFQNRYYKSSYGKKSSAWLGNLVNSTIASTGVSGVTAKFFPHTWGQSSIIATIPGLSDKTVVFGAHQDSINQASPMNGRAPGADDDGSGSITILEAFRVLLSDERVAAGQAPNTIEFHWYSAEEGGLLGSQAIFQSYAKAGRDVKSMLQQDMTGYVGTGKKNQMGLIVDNVDDNLTNFIRLVLDAYSEIPYVDTECGYACSDHASATKAGYPSAMVFESAFEDHLESIHTAQDTMDKVNFDHVLQHARITTGAAVELGFADFA
ncbi:putative Peptide hydrolase [Seiridium unicorne]|uniref:Peptide hydrolase n=1 Tax=Seiridium unicorne TaxID=138068 RepID=A0ABR2USG3_9PEZI